SYQVWIMNADGTEPKQLTTGTTSNSQPSVSPDGKTIAFTSTRDGNYEVYLMDLTGANQRNVSKSPGAEQMPTWFPDGRLGLIQDQKQGPARNAPVVRRAVKMETFAGPIVGLSPLDVNVSDFTVSHEGDVLAVISSVQVRGGFTSRLALVPVAGGARTDVPPLNPQEQVFAPSFRR